MSASNTNTPRDRPYARKVVVVGKEDYEKLKSILRNINRKKVHHLTNIRDDVHTAFVYIKKQEQVLIQLSIQSARVLRVKG